MDGDALLTWTSDELPSPLRDVLDRFTPGLAPEITIEQGWWPLLSRLHEALVRAAPNYQVRRVVPDRGRLRFEVESSSASAALQVLIDAAADESNRTCEICGRPGIPRDDRVHSYAVLCDEDT